jgi:hypothetical protein
MKPQHEHEVAVRNIEGLLTLFEDTSDMSKAAMGVAVTDLRALLEPYLAHDPTQSCCIFDGLDERNVVLLKQTLARMGEDSALVTAIVSPAEGGAVNVQACLSHLTPHVAEFVVSAFANHFKRLYGREPVIEYD